MTPAALSGPRGRHRNRMNGEPIVVDLCDTASPSGGVSSPESERYYPARVKQTGITLWPLAALWGSSGYLFIPQQQDATGDALALDERPHS